MTSAALAGLLLRQPFQPLRFMTGLDDGVFVEQPSQVRHVPGDRTVIVSHRDGGEFIINLDRVALIEVSPPRGGR